MPQSPTVGQFPIKSYYSESNFFFVCLFAKFKKWATASLILRYAKKGMAPVEFHINLCSFMHETETTSRVFRRAQCPCENFGLACTVKRL